MSLTFDTPSVVNVEILSQNRRQDLHSLRLGPLASYDLGCRTWLESFGRTPYVTPYVTPNEDGSTGRTASHNGDAGTGPADGTTEYGSAHEDAGHGSVHGDAGHESADGTVGHGSANDNAGNDSADGNAGQGSADGDAGHRSRDGDLRDEFPWWDTENVSADNEAASGSVDKDENPIRERHSDNSPTASYRSLSQAGTAAPSTTTPTPITLLTGSDVVEFRESVINEVVSWNYAPNKDTIKRRLVFEYNGDGIPAPEEIDTECRKLEGWSIEGETFGSQRFRVYDSPDLFKHNLLKCWVYLNQHQMDGWWPRGYTPRFATPRGDLPAGWVNTIDDDDRSIFTETTNR